MVCHLRHDRIGPRQCVTCAKWHAALLHRLIGASLWIVDKHFHAVARDLLDEAHHLAAAQVGAFLHERQPEHSDLRAP